MRLTRAGEYAVRCVMCLSRHGKGVVVSRQDIADQGKIPPQFLAKIAQQLSRARIIEILQGARGGYRLLRAPEEVNLLEVIEAIIGRIFLNDCVLRPESCHASPSCSVNRVWKRASEQLRRTLREVTFADLSRDESCCLVPLLQSEPLEKNVASSPETSE